MFIRVLGATVGCAAILGVCDTEAQVPGIAVSRALRYFQILPAGGPTDLFRAIRPPTVTASETSQVLARLWETTSSVRPFLPRAVLIGLPLLGPAGLRERTGQPVTVLTTGDNPARRFSLQSREHDDPTGSLVLIAAAVSLFGPILANMWKKSRTFRRQCARIAAAEQLTVGLFADEPNEESSAPARTILTLRDGRPRTAHVYVRAGVHTVQLIAHEMEHIIESLDGVDLGAHTEGGSVWKYPGGFETLRAVEMGRRVEREVKKAPLPGRPHDRSIDALAATGSEPFTVVQQNDRSVDHAPRTARLSADGRYLAFESFAQLVAADRNRIRDVYVMDLWTRQVTIESQGSNNTSADGEVSGLTSATTAVSSCSSRSPAICSIRLCRPTPLACMGGTA
jgi:hypothetical protein